MCLVFQERHCVWCIYSPTMSILMSRIPKSCLKREEKVSPMVTAVI